MENNEQISIEELKNQLRIRGDMLKATERKVEELYEKLGTSRNEWISVEERLPEWDTDKLVWYEYFRYGEYNCMFQTYGIGHYIQEYGQWFGDDLNGTKVKVLYWRELPEPPKEKSE